ncbi:hypothetical protein E1A91_D03G031600v1 [Gossypium mustelinum]|uniref:Uncharacterized protein n=1 Tax=Gossypium mustelinum TaxID=34275 RepID=A0A5D2VIK0_GOSMU|nr:hypothetical protein E1A91_D03G031600v1 [Gossypium mustelinum]
MKNTLHLIANSQLLRSTFGQMKIPAATLLSALCWFPLLLRWFFALISALCWITSTHAIPKHKSCVHKKYNGNKSTKNKSNYQLISTCPPTVSAKSSTTIASSLACFLSLLSCMLSIISLMTVPSSTKDYSDPLNSISGGLVYAYSTCCRACYL